MGLTKKDDSGSTHPMYYKENNTPLRKTKFYLKTVQYVFKQDIKSMYLPGIHNLLQNAEVS